MDKLELLMPDILKVIADIFEAAPAEVKNVKALKKGMTNHSFVFTYRDCKYIIRIPGEGTEELINRKQEADVYQAIKGKGFCEDPIYINSDNGYKITKYIENVRVCNSDNVDDLKDCMQKLRILHQARMTVEHNFDIFGMIEYYERLWNGQKSAYLDYPETKEKIFSLQNYIEAHVEMKTLTHIDAVPDNFLFTVNKNGEKQLQLTDWEYAGMQDPHVDIAMFCIYAMYTQKQVERLISIYFDGKYSKEVHTKIYCYIAACGLLWSNWCEYKKNFGVEFGEYSLRQYQFAKDYYQLAMKEINHYGM